MRISSLERLERRVFTSFKEYKEWQQQDTKAIQRSKQNE